jgi:asparagine synthase (glutamine-hydrolysing)
MVFARLAIQDLSESANQPFYSEDGRYFLLYNGELYNKYMLRAKLKESTFFKSNSDTEVLLHCIIEIGLLETLNLIEGMFAFIFVDTQLNEFFAARDMFGIKPLYYSQRSDGAILFASEIKALKSISNFELNYDLIREFLICGLIDHTASTLFSGISKVTPGTYLKVSGSKVDEVRWVKSTGGATLDSTFDEYLPNLESYLLDAICRATVSDVPLGLTLSSGVDSNLIRILLSSIGKSPNLVSVDWSDSNFRESEAAREYLRPFDTLIVENFSSQETLALIRESFAIHDEPFTSAFVAVWPEVFRRCKERGITVIFDGSGADELFYGYEKYLMSTENYTRRALDGVDVSLGFKSFFSNEPNSVEQARDLDLFSIKLPRSLRFLDYSSMSASVEVRPVFLTKAIYDLSNEIPVEWMLSGNQTKYVLRRLTEKLDSRYDSFVPKKSIQLPQNHWIDTDWRLSITAQLENIDEILDLITNKAERQAILDNLLSYFGKKPQANHNFIWRLFITRLWLNSV